MRPLLLKPHALVFRCRILDENKIKLETKIVSSWFDQTAKKCPLLNFFFFAEITQVSSSLLYDHDELSKVVLIDIG